jgi:urease accessory protein UreH
MSENIRINNKRNRGIFTRCTTFEMHRREGDSFVLYGRYTVPGWNATDEECAYAAIDAQAAENSD